MRVELKQINVNMGDLEYDMLQDILSVENGFTNPAYGLTYEEFKSWLVEMDNHSRGDLLPEGWIPYTTYILYIDDIPVGYGRIRHSSSEYLETVIGAGNLGSALAKYDSFKDYGLNVIAMFDNDTSKIGTMINGKEVFKRILIRRK